MRHARHMMNDLARALGVLALIFLSFGHAPVVASPIGTDILTAAVDLGYCGESSADDTQHGPCHACRVVGAALPPPPSVAIDAPTAAAPVAFFRGCPTGASHLVETVACPRAPPALA